MRNEPGILAHSDRGFGTRDEVLVSLILRHAYDEDSAAVLDVGAPWYPRAQVIEDMVAAKLVSSTGRGFFVNFEGEIQRWMEMARRVQKVRFLLGSVPSPFEGGTELHERWEVASALLLFTHFSGRCSWLHRAAELFGAEGDVGYELVGELEEKRLLKNDLGDAVPATLFSCTRAASDSCEAWLAGRKQRKWPLGLIDLPGRRPGGGTSGRPLPRELGLSRLSSSELEDLAAEYARRELNLYGVERRGGPGDQGRDVIGYTDDRELVVMQCKATEARSLSCSALAEELIRRPSGDTLAQYWLVSNALLSQKCRDKVAAIAAQVGAKGNHVLGRSEFDSFLRKPGNADVLLRFFPELDVFVRGQGRMPRKVNDDLGEGTWRLRSILARHLSDWGIGGRIIVRDLEFDDRPKWDGSDLDIAWRKEFHSLDDTGINVLCSPTESISIPYEHIAQWSPFEDDPETLRPHLWIVKPEAIPGFLR